MKQCSICKEIKPLTDFYRASKDKSGYQSNCKQCYSERYGNQEERKKYSKQYYHKNKERLQYSNRTTEAKEKINARKRKRYAEDPEYRARIKAYHKVATSKESTKEKVRIRAKEWAKANPERVKENQSRWVSENKEKIKENKRGYYKRAPKSVLDKRNDYLKEYRKTDNRKAVVKNYGHKRRSKVKETDITTSWLKNFLGKSSNCEICNCELDNKGNVYPNGKQLDHILPMAVGGEHKKSNVRVVCLKCNVTRPKDGSDILKLVI